MATINRAILLSTLLLSVTLLYNACDGDCSGQWIERNGMEYCVGDNMLTFTKSRQFCQQFSADLLVLDSKTRYDDLLILLNDTLSKQDEEVIDFFIGVYHRQCVESVHTGCSWLEPYSGEWYWIDSDLPITSSSDSYWQVLEPYVTGHTNLTAQDLNKQHYMVGSDGQAFPVDGFKANDTDLKKLMPLCARNIEGRTERNIDVSNTGKGRNRVFTVLYFVLFCWMAKTLCY